jgi:hypothetical protein
VEDLIAIEVTLADGGSRYFLTWGRIQDPVDPAPVCDLVVRHAAHLKPASARVCSTLREAAESDAAPYFYDGLFDFAQRGAIPRGDGYEAWRAERATAMEAGREIYDCGTPA